MSPFLPVARDANLTEGVLHGLLVGDVSVLLVRLNGIIHAIGRICTHEYTDWRKEIWRTDAWFAPYTAASLISSPATHSHPRRFYPSRFTRYRSAMAPSTSRWRPTMAEQPQAEAVMLNRGTACACVARVAVTVSFLRLCVMHGFRTGVACSFGAAHDIHDPRLRTRLQIVEPIFVRVIMI